VYNLNPFERTGEYLYTPISIVNSFVREAGEASFLTHNCSYQTLKFEAKDDWAK
jgi:hypothetical protein